MRVMTGRSGLETITVVSRRIGWRHLEEFPAQHQLSGTTAVAEEAEIADAVKREVASGLYE